MTDPAGSTVPTDGSADPSSLKVVPVRHPGRWVAGAIILLAVAMLVNTVLFSRVTRGTEVQGRFQWGVVGKYLFAGPIFRGIGITLELTVIAMAAGITIGVILAILRLSPNKLLSGAAWVYIWFFRGTPVLVQLTFWYVGISYLYPHLTFGIPFGPAFTTVNANVLVTAFVAGALGLSLNEGAYMAEIVRAGIISVDEGQTEAAQSIGMGRLQTMRRIVLPQAMRVIIPPTGNETISMLKTTSLVSTIAVADLFQATQNISNVNYEIVPLLLVASLWYLFFTSVLTVGQYYIERYYARGSTRALPLTPWQRILQTFGPGRSRRVPTTPDIPLLRPHA
jgi:polar amino acid transport system permease protein